MTRTNRPLLSIEIDMWEIQGEYANAKWHDLIETFTKAWVEKQKFAKDAALYSIVLPSMNFDHMGNSCFMVGKGLPERFIVELNAFLSSKIPGKVRYGDYLMINMSDGWRRDLRIHEGKVYQ